jgi:hypothetical protein
VTDDAKERYAILLGRAAEDANRLDKFFVYNKWPIGRAMLAMGLASVLRIRDGKSLSMDDYKEYLDSCLRAVEAYAKEMPGELDGRIVTP